MFKYLILMLSFCLFACSHLNGANSGSKFISSASVMKSHEFNPGKLIIVQGPTSDHESNINILSPRLKNYKYIVVAPDGKETEAEKYETIQPEILHWKIDKINIKNLEPKKDYVLKIVDEFRGSQTVVDKRTFRALDVSANEARFAYASCMADDYRFNEVIDPIWARMKELNPDFIVLNGDVVYVDSFEFVARQKATELDIWQRFIDSFNRIPLYKWTTLKPVFATWDDHDFGTNDSDRTFVSKQAARKIFLGFFGGKNIPGVYQLENDSVYFTLNAFHQRMLFLDDRYFRQPNKNQTEQEKYGHWGEKQHKWVFSTLNADDTPAWLINGDQVFSGTKLSFKESFQDDHPAHFQQFLDDMKTVKAPVVLASGDIHFSEIMKIPSDKLGYETYELTSSSMHSYAGSGWDNPLRVPGAFTTEFNFMMIDSKRQGNGLNIDVSAWGLSDKPYFTKNITVVK
jgi:phosphodiesterase/alkaline phosphatase D-like protein